MLSNANLLILDEPTNHLDITSKEILENALNSYTGTVLYVSHDRYFINSTATRIIELTANTLVNYIGNYDYYLEKKDILTAAVIKESVSPTDSDNTSVSSNTKEQWLSSKEEQARLKKLKNNLARVEEQISSIEERLKEIDEEYMNPDIGSNTGRLMELHKEKEELDDKLNNLYEQWEEISTEIG